MTKKLKAKLNYVFQYLSNSNFHLPCLDICYEKNFPKQMIDLNRVAVAAGQPFLFGQKVFHMLYVTSVLTTSHFQMLKKGSIKA